MTTLGTISAAAGGTGWFGHAGNSFTTALSEEDRELALGVLSPAYCTRNGYIGLTHRADGFKDFFAILTNIFVNWHKLLTYLFKERIPNTKGTKVHNENFGESP